MDTSFSTVVVQIIVYQCAKTSVNQLFCILCVTVAWVVIIFGNTKTRSELLWVTIQVFFWRFPWVFLGLFWGCHPSQPMHDKGPKAELPPATTVWWSSNSDSRTTIDQLQLPRLHKSSKEAIQTTRETFQRPCASSLWPPKPCQQPCKPSAVPQQSGTSYSLLTITRLVTGGTWDTSSTHHTGENASRDQKQPCQNVQEQPVDNKTATDVLAEWERFRYLRQVSRQQAWEATNS